MLDLDLVVPVAFLLLATAGLVYALFGIYLFLRFERSAPEKHVPVAIAALTIQYVLVFVSSFVHGYVLVPTLLLYVIALALAVAIWLGARARSKAGTRIALAGAFTLAAYVCRFGYDLYHLPHLNL